MQLAYDARLRLTSSTVNTGEVADHALRLRCGGDLLSVTLPDGSKLATATTPRTA